MSDDLRDRIAAVLRLHQWRVPPHESGLICTCGMQFGPHHTFDCHREHVADAVIAELKLERQDIGLLHRYTTEWEWNPDTEWSIDEQPR